MNPPSETFFFGDDLRRLGTFQPAAGEGRAALLFVHPFGEEKKCAHRAFVETARALAARGCASLRFDLAGCGDSEGEFADVTAADWIADIAAAWKELRSRAGDVPTFLLGLRFGALSAARACEKLSEVAALILWQPIIRGKQEFTADLRRLLVQEMITEGRARGKLRDKLADLEGGKGALSLDGYVITPAMYADICKLDLTAETANLPERTALVQFSRSSRAIESFSESAGLPLRTVPVPPIWIRSGFLPDRKTGETLAEEAVLSFVDLDGAPA